MKLFEKKKTGNFIQHYRYSWTTPQTLNKNAFQNLTTLLKQ